ncbi:MAG: hypothetical protein U0234_03670 [Sandaracinus sp.]
MHLRQVRPEWPSAEDLGRDYEDHVALKRKLDRASRFIVARAARR